MPDCQHQFSWKTAQHARAMNESMSQWDISSNANMYYTAIQGIFMAKESLISSVLPLEPARLHVASHHDS
jgi:hypothetical protein